MSIRERLSGNEYRLFGEISLFIEINIGECDTHSLFVLPFCVAIAAVYTAVAPAC